MWETVNGIRFHEELKRKIPGGLAGLSMPDAPRAELEKVIIDPDRA